MFNIKGLKVNSDNQEILHGVNLSLSGGKTHVLMGKNGSGKSTLAQVIMGNPAYMVTGGDILFNGRSIIGLNPQERAHIGIFLSFQYPSEVSGAGVSGYLRMLYNKRHDTNISPLKFRAVIKEMAEQIKIGEGFLHRSLNEGFSGGEKKKMEILQMLVLEPKLAILDEPDSGLDIDSLKSSAEAVSYLKEKSGMTVLLITHYNRILKYLKADYVYIMKEGLIVKKGGRALAEGIEEHGYSELV